MSNSLKCLRVTIPLFWPVFVKHICNVEYFSKIIQWCGVGTGLHIEVCSAVRAPELDDAAMQCECNFVLLTTECASLKFIFELIFYVLDYCLQNCIMKVNHDHSFKSIQRCNVSQRGLNLLSPFSIQ